MWSMGIVVVDYRRVSMYLADLRDCLEDGMYIYINKVLYLSCSSCFYIAKLTSSSLPESPSTVYQLPILFYTQVSRMTRINEDRHCVNPILFLYIGGSMTVPTSNDLDEPKVIWELYESWIWGEKVVNLVNKLKCMSSSNFPLARTCICVFDSQTNINCYGCCNLARNSWSENSEGGRQSHDDHQKFWFRMMVR